jgi:hypothetical protein
MVQVHLGAIESFSPTDSGEWDLDTAARLCLERFARLAFPIVSDCVLAILASIENPVMRLELLHLLWQGHNTDFCASFSQHSLDSVFQALTAPDRRLRRAALRFLNSIAQDAPAVIPACLPVWAALLHEEFELAKLAVEGLAVTIPWLPDSDCDMMVLTLFRSFREFSVPVAEEIFGKVGVAAVRRSPKAQAFCAEVVVLVTEGLEFVLADHASLSLIENMLYVLMYGLIEVKRGLAEIASRLWSVIESAWRCSQSSFALVPIHSFLIADPEAFTPFADSAFALVRDALLVADSDSRLTAALMPLSVFPIVPGREDVLQAIVGLLAPILSLDLVPRALQYVVDTFTFLLWSPVSTPAALWAALLERIRAALATSVRSEPTESYDLFQVVLVFLNDFCDSGPRDLVEVARSLIPDEITAVQLLSSVPED